MYLWFPISEKLKINFVLMDPMICVMLKDYTVKKHISRIYECVRKFASLKKNPHVTTEGRRRRGQQMVGRYH